MTKEMTAEKCLKKEVKQVCDAYLAGQYEEQFLPDKLNTGEKYYKKTYSE